MPGVRGQQVPKHVLQGGLRFHIEILAVPWPKFFEKLQPTLRLRRIRIIIERQAVGGKEQRIVGQQLARFQVKNAITTGDQICGRSIFWRS